MDKYLYVYHLQGIKFLNANVPFFKNKIFICKICRRIRHFLLLFYCPKSGGLNNTQTVSFGNA